MLNPDQCVELIERDVDSAPQDAVVYALSRARLARGLACALIGHRREALVILETEAETKLFGTDNV
jgi:hypothetical protein